MNYRKINGLLFLFVSILTFNQTVQANSFELVSFSKCVDGDTAVFKMKNEDIKVRFLAIDTPETVHPTKGIEAFGKNASEYTCTKITNAKKIKLEYDSGSAKTDKYGRHLAWIWVDEVLLQKSLVEIGYAKVAYLYGKYVYTNELYEAQTLAQTNKLGIWGDYIPQVYTIRFDEGKKIKEVLVTENQRVESYTPEKQGYSFVAWHLNNKEFDFDTLINDNLTLSAVYEKKLSFIDIILVLLLITILYFTNQKNFKKKLKKFV